MRIRRRQINNTRLEEDRKLCMVFFPTKSDKKLFENIMFTTENLYYREGYEHGWADRDVLEKKVIQLEDKFQNMKETGKIKKQPSLRDEYILVPDNYVLIEIAILEELLFAARRHLDRADDEWDNSLAKACADAKKLIYC